MTITRLAPRPGPAGLVPGLPDPGRCLVMGVLNVTPDSFSDGGIHLATGRAIEHGLTLAATGADLVDVGGESTRPGASRVPVHVELARTVPVVRALAGAGLVVSIDTTRAVVARAALDAGAALINDVSGGLADPAMPTCVAEAEVPYVAMHWRGPSCNMLAKAQYRDVVGEVTAELRARLHALREAGVAAERVILDPGLGFAKTADHNWQLLRRFDELAELGRPILVGASRKSFLGAILATADAPPPAPTARDMATAAVSALAAAAGAYCVRVHDVPSTLDAVRVASAWTQGTR